MILVSEVLKDIEKHEDYVRFGAWWRYIGGQNKTTMHWVARKGLISWNSQRERCSNPRHSSYCYYGAKGVKRIWTSKECIDFYINELFKREKWKAPRISRYGDTGNYCLGNVKLIELVENNKEIAVTPRRRLNGVIYGKLNGPKNVRIMIEKNKKKVKITELGNSLNTKIFNSGRECDVFLRRLKGTTTHAIHHKVNFITVGGVAKGGRYSGTKYKPGYI